MFLADQAIDEIARSARIGAVKRLEDQLSLQSLVQPCSLDLTIGRIFVPGAAEDVPGSLSKPITTQHTLEPGQTAVAETEEVFNLPDDIAGFGFPPARVSRFGLLMTNPGHVDAGYEGRMSFTIVNMGRRSYSLNRGDVICTLLLFRLKPAPGRSYRQRLEGSASTQRDYGEVLDRLSPDFLDFTRRSREIAEQSVDKARIRLRSWQVWVPVLVALITAVASIIVNMYVVNSDVREDISVLQANIERLDLDKRLTILEQNMER